MPLRLALSAMATRFELVLDGGSVDSAQRDASFLRAVGEEALEEVRLAEQRLSLFRRDSLLAHMNRTAASSPVRLDPDTFALFAAADEAFEATGGAFDPTVAPLMEAHGFRGEAQQALATAQARVGWAAVRLDRAARRVAFDRPGTQLDFGGIAKGHALDLAARVLVENGIETALLHGGTSAVVALGAPAGQPGWRVALGPEPDAPVVVLRDAALAVSAPHGRSAHGRGHVLDPRTGEASVGASEAAVIVPLRPEGRPNTAIGTAPDECALADALATALVVTARPFATRDGTELAWRTAPQTTWRFAPESPLYIETPDTSISA